MTNHLTIKVTPRKTGKRFDVTMGGETIGTYPITKAIFAGMAVNRALIILGTDVTFIFPGDFGTVTLFNGVVEELCNLCGQRLDGKPCGCGARPTTTIETPDPFCPLCTSNSDDDCECTWEQKRAVGWNPKTGWKDCAKW